MQEQLQQCKAELDNIDSIIRSSPLDKNVPYLTMYALIKSCGTIEYVFKSIVADYFSISTIPQIHTYIDNTVREGYSSPKYDNICRLIRKFDDKWTKAFKQNIEDHPNKNKIIDSINSLVNNRHQFAHGKNPTVSFKEIQNYYSDSVEVLNILDAVVK